ncbi:MAG: hypothetical protein HDR82_09615 [Bacteroides sp.]|nr:hypothetical protein [Bacteroides sp.]
MQAIDLTQPGDNYKVITFPDGEIHLELSGINRKEPIAVRCRITNAADLFILMQLADIIKRQCLEVAILEIYYLMGMRCDRLFDINRPFTLGIVADVVNSLNAREVCIYEPHSAKSSRLIKNSADIFITTYLAQKKPFAERPEWLFVAPDKGAAERYRGTKFAVVCEKVRDEATGKLLSFKATPNEEVTGRDLLVIDDLCDGGGTFVGLAPKLRELQPQSLSLLVTHAVQRAGIEKVAKAYDKVYITSTYKNWEDEELPDNVEVFSFH